MFSAADRRSTDPAAPLTDHAGLPPQYQVGLEHGWQLRVEREGEGRERQRGGSNRRCKLDGKDYQFLINGQCELAAVAVDGSLKADLRAYLSQ